MKIHGLTLMLETAILEETIAFYTEKLGFECVSVYKPEDKICWARLQNGNYDLAFGLPNAHMNFVKPQLTGTIYLRIENIDEVWKELKDEVEIIYPLENFNYGMREFGIRDCNGYILNLGSEIEGG